MVIKPKIFANVCINAHPLGCAAQVEDQINYVKSTGSLEGPKRVLIIGASDGYGLASRIVSAFACGADTIGLSYERAPRPKRTASSGWYKTAAFMKQATAAGLGAWSIDGDAFSKEIKQETADALRTHLGQIDMLVYSIAAPRRLDPETGEVYSSVIKPIGAPYTGKTMDFQTGVVSEVTVHPATDQEVEHTIKVMGGEDWRLWIDMLLQERLLAQDFLTVTYTYVGPEATRATYRDGTIGKAKEDLEQTAIDLGQVLSPVDGKACISVQKAIVTRASAVIPAVPLYMSLLYQVMKSKGLHENCIQQINRLYREFLFTDGDVPTDKQSRIRLDDWEMREDVQADVMDLWHRVTTENAAELADIKGFQEDFLHQHGFGLPRVDYVEDVDPMLV
ncbi:MAG: trans-2-enoyl-CoA reductase family protein [Planctomycetes bacterium]|nr:trans-2-enoyl-CoA reductase family protein [Planctomycetota bacterium]